MQNKATAFFDLSYNQAAQEKEKIVTGYHEAFYSDIDAEIQEQAKRADEEEYLNKNNAPDNTDYLEAVERHIKYTKKIKLNARRHNVKFRSIQII